MGLGLSIVKEIVEQHGGRAWLDPGLEKGITFHVAIGKIPKALQEKNKAFKDPTSKI